MSYGIEECLDRVETATNTLSVQVAASTQRIDAIDSMSNKVQQDIRDLREFRDNDSKFLHQRIDGVQRDLSERIDSVQSQLTEKLDKNKDALSEHFDQALKPLMNATNADSKRIRSLEAWRMSILGAGGVLTFLLVDVIVRFFGTPLADFFVKFFIAK
jgi:chromosome segregation ATPase